MFEIGVYRNDDPFYTPEPLVLRVLKLGRDRMITLTGGAGHIGAIATSYYEAGEQEPRTLVQGLPGHKEAELAKIVAERAARAFKCTVSVAMGIHLDDATPEMIHRMVADAYELVEQALGSHEGAHMG